MVTPTPETILALQRLQALQEERARRSLTSERGTRVERGRRDPEWWLRQYLPHLYPCGFGEHHRTILQDFQAMVERAAAMQMTGATEAVAAPSLDDDGAAEEMTEEDWTELLRQEAESGAAMSAAYACPREHGKSTLLVGLVLWAVCYRLVHYPVIVSDTVTQAVDRLGEILAELEDNERIIADFGTLRGDRRWTGWDAVTSTGIRLRAYGARSKLRGAKHGAARPDLAVIDDAENDEAILTESQRQKLRVWLTRVLLNAIDSDRGVVIAVGTILHHDSLLARLTGQDWFPGWRKRRFAALRVSPDGVISALWPERWPVAKLQRHRVKIGASAFASEFQNDPVTDDTSPFKLAWLNQAKEAGRGIPWAEDWAGVRRIFDGLDPLVVISAWDFGWVDDKAHAEEADSNYTAGLGIAVHPKTRHRYLIRGYHERGMTPIQIRSAVKVEAEVVRPGADSSCRFRVAVETVGLQKQLYGVGLREETDLPVAPVFTDSGKHDPFKGVPGLAALFESLQWVFCWDDGLDESGRRQRNLVQAVINELHGLGKEAHDDLVMTLWFAETLIRRMLEALDRELKRGETAEEREKRDGRVRVPIGRAARAQAARSAQ